MTFKQKKISGPTGEKLDEIKKEPMDNEEIRKYLGKDFKILTTRDINNYSDINEIFDIKKYVDYVILLFEDEENSGHWCGLLKYGDIIEFFDSYGQSVKEVYKFAQMANRIALGTEKDKLNEILENAKEYNVIYNNIQFQAETGEDYDISTCGRHCCFRILQLIGRGMILPEYDEYMKELKKHYKLSYDDIVAKIIDI